MWPWQRREERKSAGRALVALSHPALPRWGARSAAALARDGYLANPVAHRCVRLVAEAAASVPMATDAPALAGLLRRPAPGRDGTHLLEALYAHLQLSGNAFLEAVTLSGESRPGGLFVLRPDRMTALTGPTGWVEGWLHEVGGRRRTLRPDADGWLPVMHLALFHPTDDIHGLAPLGPARQALDLHNGGADWQKALLDNSARPSGALVYGGSGPGLTPEQFDRLKAQLEEEQSGPRNAGRPLLLEGGLDWKPMSLTPADMDFREAREGAAREIALALGVPPMLLGIPGDNTYANYREANIAFWRMTVLPLVRKMADALSAWLGPRFDAGDTSIRPRTEEVPALAADRAEQWRRLDEIAFLSLEEKRALAGLAPVEADR